MDTVILESVKGAWTLSTGLPSGAKHTVEFKKEKDGERFLAEVPMTLEYLDWFKEKQTLIKNYPQALLDAYNKKDQYGEVTDLCLKVLEIKKAPEITVDAIKEAPISKRSKKNENAVA